MEQYFARFALFSKGVPHAVLDGFRERTGGHGVECRVDRVVVDGDARVPFVVLGPGLGNLVSIGPLCIV